jgi:hypothetical protein
MEHEPVHTTHYLNHTKESAAASWHAWLVHAGTVTHARAMTIHSLMITNSNRDKCGTMHHDGKAISLAADTC